MALTRLTSGGLGSNVLHTTKQINLLYVEDEDLNWEITVLHLATRYHLRRAKSAMEAFSILKNQEFHAILMDIQLSGSDMDGINVTKALRGKLEEVPKYAEGVVLPEVPIIFMTAYAARYKLKELQQVGGDELVRKPVDFTQLNLTLSRCLLKSVNRSSK